MPIDFREPVTQAIYSSTNKLNFGKILPGGMSGVKQIEVVNNTPLPLTDVKVGKGVIPEGVTLEISEGNDPAPSRASAATADIKDAGVAWMEYYSPSGSQFIIKFSTINGYAYTGGTSVWASEPATMYRVTSSGLVVHAYLAPGENTLSTRTNFLSAEMIAGNVPIYDNVDKSSILLPMRKQFASIEEFVIGSMPVNEHKRFFARMKLAADAVPGTTGSFQFTVTGKETV